jgi:hypothetical protein
MKKSIIICITAVSFFALGFTAHAGKPVDEKGMPFGNGFPSGYHYNLNILGKQDNFTCPQPEYVDGMQVYGNVIFIRTHKHWKSLTGVLKAFRTQAAAREMPPFSGCRKMTRGMLCMPVSPGNPAHMRK